MKLYFGSTVSAVTTLMLPALLGFVGCSFVNRADIQYWGRRSLLLLVFGFVVCCLAAARDGLDKTIQHAIDGSCAPGIFPLVSVPTIIGCIGALINVTEQELAQKCEYRLILEKRFHGNISAMFVSARLHGMFPPAFCTANTTT